MRVHVHQDGLKLNGTHKFLVVLMKLIYWAEAHILQRKTQSSLVVASKESGIE
jgi:hypothetical protein